MSDTDNNSVSADFKFVLNQDYLRDGEHTLVIPVPDEISILVGKIAVGWGGFEIRMDKTIEAILIRLGQKGPQSWQRMNFKRRRKLFKDTLANYTKQLFPNETETFRTIADTAGDLHWRRNTVVHGYVNVRVTATSGASGEIAFFATGIHNNKQVDIPLDGPTLEKLYHDIAHLGGNLMAAINRMGGTFVTPTPEFVISDREILQGPPQGSLTPLPIASTPRRPPRSS